MLVGLFYYTLPAWTARELGEAEDPDEQFDDRRDGTVDEFADLAVEQEYDREDDEPGAASPGEYRSH